MSGRLIRNGNVMWVLYSPHPTVKDRYVPVRYKKNATLWFTKDDYIEHFIKRNKTLPKGCIWRGIMGWEVMLKLANELLLDGADVIFIDAQDGKEMPGESMTAFATELRDNIDGKGEASMN